MMPATELSLHANFPRLSHCDTPDHRKAHMPQCCCCPESQVCLEHKGHHGPDPDPESLERAPQWRQGVMRTHADTQRPAAHLTLRQVQLAQVL